MADADEVSEGLAASRAASLLRARLRIRRALGMGPDEWDDLVAPAEVPDDDGGPPGR